MDVDFVKPLFHRGVIDFVLGIGEMSRCSRQATWHPSGGNDTDVAIVINQVRPDQQLLRLLVDHPVGGRAADAVREGVDAIVRINLKKLVG